MNGHLMASYVRNVYTKNYKNFVIFPQVIISNVTDGFWRFLFILMRISCVLISQVVQKHMLGEVET